MTAMDTGPGQLLESGEGSPGEEQGAGSGPHEPLRLPQRAARPAAVAVGAVVLFLCALREARALTVDSDGGSNALQAWAMLHGNLLLHGWHLSDVSWYTTELPEYMLVELVRGLRPDVVPVSAALTYTLLVVLAALVAKGRAAGRAGLVRASIAVGIMLAPSLSAALNVLTVPDHTGSAAPVLVVLILLDRAGRRWYVPLITGLTLAWAVVGDPLVLIIGVAPVLVVSLARAANTLVRQREPLQEAWFELSLAAAAVAAAGVAAAADHVIRASGGYVLAQGVHQFLPSATLMPANLALTGQTILHLFSADFFGHRFGPGLAVIAIHLIGAVLVAVALWLAVRRLFWSEDLVPAILAAAIIANVLAYLVIFRASYSPSDEVAPVFSLGAALAGRVLGGPLLHNRLEPLLAVWLVCCAWMLVPPVLLAKPASANPTLTAWLQANHLHDGIAGYGLANRITIDTGGQVRMRSVMDLECSGVTPVAWDADEALLNSRSYNVNFLLTTRRSITEAAAISDFGRPAQTYHVQGTTILVWHKNLLPQLNRKGLPALARTTLGGGWSDASDPHCRVVRS